MRKITRSSFRSGRRTTTKNWRRRQNKRYRATTNLTEGTKNSKKHARKRSRSKGRVKKREQQGHARRRQGAWPDIKPEQQTIPKKKRKKKIRKGIASSRRRTLSGEVAAEKKKARRSHAWKKGGTCPGMQRDYQTNQKRRNNNKMRREFTNSWKGTILREIKAGKTKMIRHRPQARWLFMEEGQNDLPNRRLRFQRKEIKKCSNKSKSTT